MAHSIDTGPQTHRVAIGSSPDTVASSIRIADAAPLPALTADEDRPACICFTSGSTGLPKGAWFCNHQLRAIAELDTAGAWGGGGHGISPTQFAHVGFMTKLPWLLASGRTTHLLERWEAGAVLRLVAEHRMTAITAGGGASSPALVREARERFGVGYSIRYSSTESGGVGLATALDADDDEALQTIGRPRSGVEAMVLSPDGSPIHDGEIGELALRSPAIMSGYWNDPDATAEVVVDGWLRTGDLASRDASGRFRLAGRTKEIFVRGGYNVYPMEVESVLCEHPGVAEIVVVPRPDDVMAEIGVAVVVAVPHTTCPTLEELREFGAVHLSRYRLPERLVAIPALPRNASDKIDRRAVRESLATPPP